MSGREQERRHSKAVTSIKEGLKKLKLAEGFQILELIDWKVIRDELLTGGSKPSGSMKKAVIDKNSLHVTFRKL